MPEDIATASALSSKGEANSEPFPMHKPPIKLVVKKEALGDVAIMRCTLLTPSYGAKRAAHHRLY